MKTDLVDLNTIALSTDSAESLLGGDLDYYAHAISPHIADALYQQLRTEIEWQQDVIHVYGKQHLIPRLQSWIGDPEARYTYSGRTLIPASWTSTTQKLCQLLNQEFDTQFNSVLANYYRNGLDTMGWHSDDELELGVDPIIASLSFGAVRDFALRKVGVTRQHGVLPLENGSLLMMKAGMQCRWQHSLPARKGVTDGRINLTFRKLVH